MMHVKALRGFWHEGKLVKAGAVVEIHEGLVRELVSSQKAEVVPEAHPAKVQVKEAEKHDPKHGKEK
jgi:hypothetical protein